MVPACRFPVFWLVLMEDGLLLSAVLQVSSLSLWIILTSVMLVARCGAPILVHSNFYTLFRVGVLW